jgi:hypothetical protein
MGFLHNFPEAVFRISHVFSEGTLKLVIKYFGTGLALHRTHPHPNLPLEGEGTYNKVQ